VAQGIEYAVDHCLKGYNAAEVSRDVFLDLLQRRDGDVTRGSRRAASDTATAQPKEMNVPPMRACQFMETHVQKRIFSEHWAHEITRAAAGYNCPDSCRESNTATQAAKKKREAKLSGGAPFAFCAGGLHCAGPCPMSRVVH